MGHLNSKRDITSLQTNVKSLKICLREVDGEIKVKCLVIYSRVFLAFQSTGHRKFDVLTDKQKSVAVI